MTKHSGASVWERSDMRDKRSALAYLLGAFLSDGTLVEERSLSLHPKWCVTDESFANCIAIALSDLGSLYSRYYYPPRASDRLGTWVVYELEGGELGWWLDDYAGGKEALPGIPRDLLRPLVAGLMDGDGSACRSKQGCFHLTFAGVKGFVRGFYTLLQSQGVGVGKLQVLDEDLLQWNINKESFLAHGLGFAMPRKQEILALWCCKVQRTALKWGHSHYLRKARVAKWWMEEVYVKDFASPYPTGERQYPGL